MTIEIRLLQAGDEAVLRDVASDVCLGGVEAPDQTVMFEFRLDGTG